MANLARTSSGRECWISNQQIPRHRHAEAYAAVILAGGYEECGGRGRFRVGPGDVLLHDAFDAHLDRFSVAGAHILNLILPDPVQPYHLGRIDDPDLIARAAERDPVQAREALGEQLRVVSPPIWEEWTDELACRLLDDPACRLDTWADDHGLSAETVSRGFGKVFGVAPAAFRAEMRVHRALVLLATSDRSLAAIAASAGFADQAHMCRGVRALTGLPPNAWRRSNSFKTVRELAG